MNISNLAKGILQACFVGVIVLLLWVSFSINHTVPVRAEPQGFATNYIWVDSLTTTTVAVDSAFTTIWEQVVIKSVGDAWIRIGAPDVANWSSREWYSLESGEALSFGPATKLTRLEWKANAGTVVFYMVGYKTVIQQ